MASFEQSECSHAGRCNPEITKSRVGCLKRMFLSFDDESVDAFGKGDEALVYAAQRIDRAGLARVCATD